MKTSGVVIFITGVICAVVYTLLMFFSPWKNTIIEVSAYLSIMIIIATLIFVGYLIATTPENKPVSVEERVKEMVEEDNN